MALKWTVVYRDLECGLNADVYYITWARSAMAITSRVDYMLLHGCTHDVLNFFY
jgi:hypothetical protein